MKRLPSIGPSVDSRFPTIAILITAASFAGFAVWLGVNPNALLNTFGIEDRTPQMATEIRAFYGGVKMAIAVAMIRTRAVTGDVLHADGGVHAVASGFVDSPAVDLVHADPVPASGAAVPAEARD